MANFFRNRTAVSLTFVIPIVLIYIFGQVFGLNRGKDPGPIGIKLGVVNASSHPAAQKLLDALQAEPSFQVVTTYETPDRVAQPLTEAVACQRIQVGEYRFALVIPPDVLPTNRGGLHFVILSDPRNEIETQMVNGLLQKTILTSVPQLLGQSLQVRAKEVLGDARLGQFNHNLATSIATAFGGDTNEIQRAIEAGNFGVAQSPVPAQPPADPTLRGNTSAPAASPKPEGTPATAAPAASSSAPDFLKQIVNIETKQVVGQHVKSPAATRVVGGWAIMFLLFAVSSSSAAFFDEKNAGLFQRLLSAPVHRSQLLWSRFLFSVVLGVLQLTGMFLAGRLMYGIDVFGHFGNLIIICIAAAAACTSFGMLIAAVSPNAQAANGLATFVVMMMCATGGAWFPIGLMPEFMQKIGKLTVVYWSMEGFAQVLWAGNTLREILPTLGILLGIAAGVMAIAIWRINRKTIFD